MVTVRSTDRAVDIAIVDTGCGIPREHLPRVLEPFFTTKPHGNGLGLSICRSVLWEVDGTITIQSEAGNGTRVHVPFRRRWRSRMRRVMRPARILVVDDEPGMLRAVDRVLSKDHHVVGTRLSRDALSLAAIFIRSSDRRHPYARSRRLRADGAAESALHGLDVILMTGSVDDLDEKLVRAIRSPAFYFIQKPFNRDVLGRSWSDASTCAGVARSIA